MKLGGTQGEMKAPYVNMMVNNVKVDALLDSGASVSLISEKLIKNEKLEPYTKKVQDASGNAIPIIGKLKVTLSTPDGAFAGTLLVYSAKCTLKVNAILGTNILKYASINLYDKQIRFSEGRPAGDCVEPTSSSSTTVKIISNKIFNDSQHARSTHGLCEDERESESTIKQCINVHLTEELELKENSVTVTTIKTAQKLLRENSTVMLKCSESKRGIVVSNAISVVQNGEIAVNIINITDEKITLKKGSQLCEATLLNETEINTISVHKAKKKVSPLRKLTKEDINCRDSEMTHKMVELLNEFRQVCWLEGEPLGHYTGDALEIELKEKDLVTNKKPYRIPHAKQEKLDIEIADMLEKGVISRSKSHFNSPLIIVPKPNGQIRPCIDYRALNKNTVPITFPIPRIADLLNSLSTTKVISSLDLASAYHQCDIKTEDRYKTAFTVGATKYEFNKVAFGLTSSPGFFSRVVNETLYDILGANVICYMDDVMVFTKDSDTHLKKIRDVLVKLSEANLKIKVVKCKFFANSVKFLGYDITTAGMTMDKDRTESLKAMPYPQDKRQLQSFLGAVNYFRCFVRNFADLAEPLYSLLRKDVRFNWNERHNEAVDKLKHNLCNKPILKFPDFGKPFFVHSDASLVGIGACLLQEHEGILHPVSYVSRCLSEPQRNYSTTKREALALVFALEQFRYLILSYPVTVFTDHLPLLGIITKPTKDATITRWALLVQEYAVNIKYLPGKDNVFSDALSRLVDVENSCESLPEELDDKLIGKIAVIDNKESEDDVLNSYLPVKVPWTESELKAAQNEDEKCKEIRSWLKDPNNDSLKLKNFRILKGIIYVQRSIKRSKFNYMFLVPYVPDKLMKLAFKVIHDEATAGHKSFERTIKLFQKNFYNHQEGKQILALCKSCEWCIKAKAQPKPIPSGEYPIPEQPFQTVSSDILGPLPLTEGGNQYIITFRDFTTRYTVLIPLEHKSADSVVNALRQVISHYGSCEVLLTDNAREYTSDKLRKFCTFYNIRKTEITPHRPSSNGLAERINSEVTKLLRIYTQQLATDDWDELLPVIQLTINNTLNVSLGDSPFFTLYGYDSPTVTLNPPKIDYQNDELSDRLKRIKLIRKHCRENLLKAQHKYTLETSERPTKPIQMGQRVYAKLTKQIPKLKLDLPVSGPFTVTGKKGKAYYIRSQELGEFLVHPDELILSQGEPVSPPESITVQAAPRTETGLTTSPPEHTPQHDYALRSRK